MNKSTTLHDFAGGTDKSYAHQYIHFYDGVLSPFRNSYTDVLEIGVYTGGSIRMWRDYFPNAHVYGVDIANACNSMHGESRVTFLQKDAYTDEAVDGFGDQRFDFIIDDGPHTFESQLFVASVYPKLLKQNGILMIEDIPDQSWIRSFSEAVPDRFRPYCYGVDRRWVPGTHPMKNEIIFVVDMRYVQG